ncbi:hypothetical protein B0T19DRAFT_244150 [Cercophora scortea]|uniref:Uncharacterized protein n=1 Tax=Cercophora scortea TaxID=314031 RepID=A0AAE0M6B1_9PEZI|nr:hypothetical protein B0T19DRAFT_244150 [Cercophora scortea]
MMSNLSPTKRARKLNTWHIIILPIGILINLSYVALLSILWFADSDNNTIWQRIVLNGWATRLVVIISLVIRTVVGFHSVICVSMLCALVLEKFETPLAKVAAVSIMRYQNGGAFDLAFFTFLLRGAPTATKAALAIPSALLFVVLVGLQFTSTALLSDFGSRLMVVQQPETPYAYAFINSTEVEGPLRAVSRTTTAMETSDTCLKSPPLFPAFIEYSEPPRSLPDGAFDTGTLFRGFLPFEQESQRTELVRYTGMATLYDNRVVCVRPSANLTNIQLRLLEHQIFSSGNLSIIGRLMYEELSGYVGSDLVVPRFNRSRSPIWFNCSGAAPFQSLVSPNFEEWPLVICNVGADGGPLPSLGDSESHPHPAWDLAGFLYAPDTRSFLILNTSYTSSTNPDALFKPEAAKINSTSVKYMGEWLQIEFPHSFTASLSLCYTSEEVRIREVDVFRPPPSHRETREPTASWNDDEFSFETEAVRQQLGATLDPLSLPERGLFQLLRPPTATWNNSTRVNKTGRAPPWPPVILNLSNMLFYNKNDENNSSSICYGCFMYHVSEPAMHPVHASVFNKIVRETSSPGLALQALVTSLHAAQYYSVSYLFSEEANATTWIRTTGSAPVQSLFFGLVVAAIALETVLTVGITLAFLWGTRYTSLGNAWQSVSQVTGNNVDKWRADSTLTDGEIKFEMEREGLAEKSVGLVDVDEERIRFRGARTLVPSSGSGAVKSSLSVADVV